MFQGSVLKGLTEEKHFSENGQVKEMGWNSEKAATAQRKPFFGKIWKAVAQERSKKKGKNRWLKTFAKYRLHGYQILVLLLQLDITALKMM